MRTRAHEQVVKFRTFLRTVCHELLHHLLRGSVNGEAHPFVPFVWPCHLIGTVGG